MSAPSPSPTTYPEAECRSCRALLDGRGLCPSCDLRAVTCPCTDGWRNQPLNGCQSCDGTGRVRL